MFISGEPDHWCRVPEVMARGNLSQSHMKRLTIPRVDLGPEHEDIVIYERCRQYDANYTWLFEENGGAWPDAADPAWPTSKCQNGWVYDTSEYKNTLVTEVSMLMYSEGRQVWLKVLLAFRWYFHLLYFASMAATLLGQAL